ncbi:protein SENSITIVE TO UV 2 isoform X2 [Fagus crenata]
MNEEGFEEWDADFLDQLIQVEELALSSSSKQEPVATNTISISYSPPRHTSQRTDPFTLFSNGIAKSDLEIDRLKRELGHVSKQLTDLERECLQLRKERDKKEDQLQIFSNNHSSNATAREYGVVAMDYHGVPQNAISSNGINRALPTYKAIGIQTEKAADPALLTLNVDPPASHALSQKLLAIWGSPSDQKLGRNLISKFGCGDTWTCRKLMGFLIQKVQYRVKMISIGMVQLEALFETLLDLCSLENVVIVHRSLCILPVFLKHLLGLERNSERRDNVTVEGLRSGNNIVDFHGSDRGLFCVSRNETPYEGYTPLGIRLPNAEIPCMKGPCNHDIAISVSRVDWVSLFEAVHQIIVRNTEECVRLEAVSVMNVVLVRRNAYMERGKFGQAIVFEILSQLLRKEAGLRVQRSAVHLLYLLLNCPKLLVMFCSDSNEGDAVAAAVDDNSRSQKFIKVLQGLADCVACSGNDIQELTLRRNAIIVLAFLASSGKSEANFLMLILQVLVSEIDIEEAAVCAESPEIFKERTLLIREVLILLNRLVSNPAYSVTVLRVLTNSRDMASLTIDIANRLSSKYERHGQSDCITRQMRESEIVNLARVFRKRVFTYLGENIS